MAAELSEPSPLGDLLEAFSQRTPIGSALRSEQWALVPAMLRRGAFFSSTVRELRWLAEAQDALEAILAGRREMVTTPEGEEVEALAMDRTAFVERLQGLGQRLGLEPEDPALRGGIQDPTSERRLSLIVDTQLAMAYGYGDYVSGQDPDILNEWPAQELVRVRQVREERDWITRWQSAEWGAQDLVQGRMVALKTDPVWVRISRFQQPWPPFDYNSGMGLREIDRDEAVELGLLGDAESLTPDVAGYEESLEMSVRGLSERARDALQAIFGDQVARETGDQLPRQA